LSKLSNNYHQKKEIVYENPPSIFPRMAAAVYKFIIG